MDHVGRGGAEVRFAAVRKNLCAGQREWVRLRSPEHHLPYITDWHAFFQLNNLL